MVGTGVECIGRECPISDLDEPLDFLVSAIHQVYREHS